MNIIPIILAGGSGTRLWPMSRETLPKQFLRLTSQYSLFQETIQRARRIADLDKFIIVSNIQHYFMCLDHLHEIGIDNLKFVLEPIARNTAPAIACAAWYAQELAGSSATLLVLPSDHLITDQEVFSEAVAQASKVAEKDWLVTFGIKPNLPEIGYGYIEISDKKIEDAFQVKRFIEKPNLELAEQFIASDKFYWNSGMFMFHAQTYLNELEILAPQIYEYSKQAYFSGQKKIDHIILDEQAFSLCPNNSIDYAVMEKTTRAAVLPFYSFWSDLGCWSAVAKVGDCDDNFNVIRGNVITRDSQNCFLSSENHLIAAIGLKDQIVVSTPDAILVVDKAHAQQVKHIVNQLKLDQKKLATHHKKIYRDWGHYEFLTESDSLQIKAINIKVNQAISIKATVPCVYWIHLSGEGEITNSNSWVEFSNHLSFSMKREETYLLSNTGDNILCLIEMQFNFQKSSSENRLIFEDTYA